MKKFKYKLKNSSIICEEIRSDEDKLQLKKMTHPDGNISYETIYDGHVYENDENGYIALKNIIES